MSLTQVTRTLATLNTTIARLSSTITANETKATAGDTLLSNRINGVQTALTQLQNRFNGNPSIPSNLNVRLLSAESRLDSLSSSVSLLSSLSSLSDAGIRIGALESGSASLNTQVQDAQFDIVQLQMDVTTLKIQVQTIEDAAAAEKERVNGQLGNISNSLISAHYILQETIRCLREQLPLPDPYANTPVFLSDSQFPFATQKYTPPSPTTMPVIL